MKHHYNYSHTYGKQPPKNAKTDQWSLNTGGGRLQELNKRRPSFSEKRSMHIYTMEDDVIHVMYNVIDICSSMLSLTFFVYPSMHTAYIEIIKESFKWSLTRG